MKYDLSSPTSPSMPALGKGLKCIKLLASQVSPDMQEAIVPLFFPPLGAYISNVRFRYPDDSWKELCGLLGHLVAPSGTGKGQLTTSVRAIMRQFSTHDEAEMQRLREWQRQVKTKGANKDKPERPDIALWFPPSDVTNPAFLQNAQNCGLFGYEHGVNCAVV